MIQHQWGKTDKYGVQACTRPGCTVRRLASAVPTIWQRKPGAHWRSVTRTKMGPCTGKESP